MSGPTASPDARRGAALPQPEPQAGQQSPATNRGDAPQQDAESFNQILESIADGVSIIDASLQLRYVNPALVADFGPYEGRTCYEYYLGRQEPCPWCNNEEVFAGRTIRYEWASEQSGKIYDLIDSPLTNPDGTISKLEIFRDITERRRLEEQLRQSQKLEAVGRLAGGVAHDFNNMLAVIMSNAAFVREALRPGDPALEDVAEITEAAKRAAALVKQLLAFSRRQVLLPKVLELNDVVSRTETMLARLIGEHIRLEIRLEPELRRVRADPGQLEQGIVNLALNARDAMPTGGTLRIETANVDLSEALSDATDSSLTGPGVVMAVEDSGMGMDEATLSRAFEPFFSTKEVGQGSGLGLATVYGIVKQSGGEARVKSKLGEGTRFEVYLPAQQPDAQKAGDSEPPVTLPGAATETVLLVEDDVAVRRATSRILTRRGYNVLEAGNGADAVHVSEQFAGPIHLLLADVVMPEISGPEAYRQLAERRPELKVLYMSGHTDASIEPHGALEAGTELIQKPFSATELANALRSAIAGSSDKKARS